MSDERPPEREHTVPVEAVPRFATAAYDGALHIRCPHCRDSVHLRAEDSLTNISCQSCGSRFSLIDESAAEPGAVQMIAHFELVEQLGRGAFGAVWKARDTQLDRLVAVKIPRQSQLPAAEAEMFLREARAAAQLQHPHIVRVHEVGRDGNTVYIVSELIQGVTLARWLTTNRPSPREAAQLCIKLAAALVHAHDKGIVHRDLKPQNIMLDESGEPHLMDFGLARRDAGELTVTVDGQIMGTPAYMSPEQARGQAHRADQRTDIYSLGVILFQLLTGELPFRGDVRMLIEQVLRDEPPSPRRLSALVPRDLETICLKCLEKEPDKRYATAQQLHDDLEHFLRSEPITARPVTSLERAWRWCRRNPAVAGLAAAVVALLVLVSIGATTAAVLQHRAQQRILAEERRAEREARERVELLKTEDAAALAMLKEQIRAERFIEARHTLEVAQARLAGTEILEGRRPAWQRLAQIVEFYCANDEAWNQWGEENYRGVMAAAQSALLATRVFEDANWWAQLPSQDLDPDEQRRLEQEVYRLLMLNSAVQTVLGTVLAERLAHGEAVDPASAIGLFRGALVPLERAQAWEMSDGNTISITSNIMEQLNRALVARLGEPPGEAFLPHCDVRRWAADNYFLGLMFFVVERSASDQNPLYAVLTGQGNGGSAAVESASAADSPPGGLLVEFLAKQLAQNEIPQADTALATSEQLLRIAAGQERRYWPCFALGRTLFFRGKFHEAELAFNTCAALRPDYGRSFEQRALMRGLVARQTADAQERAMLTALALADSDRALALALKADDPSTWWPRGDLFALIDRPRDAIAAYTRALEWEDNIRQKVNRRNNLAVVERVAERILADDDQPADLIADAAGVSALATIALDHSDGARSRASALIERGVAQVPGHAHLLTARGLVALSEADAAGEDSPADADLLQRARQNFEQALVSVPDNYMAAHGRAIACERLQDWPGALSAWTYLLAPKRGGPESFSSVAVTPEQRQLAEAGRERVRNRIHNVTAAGEN